MFRPTKEEMDVLEEFGNEGWNWPSLLECFKKVRSNLGLVIHYTELVLVSNRAKHFFRTPYPKKILSSMRLLLNPSSMERMVCIPLYLIQSSMVINTKLTSLGPIMKSLPAYKTQLHSKYLDALETLGVHRKPESVSLIHLAQRTLNNECITITTILPPIGLERRRPCWCIHWLRLARRSYSASAYYEPNKDRKNLLILTEAHTAKVR